MADPVEVARRLADELLFPRAPATDARPVLAAENLDALADADLYGLTGPVERGGLGADFETVCGVAAISALAVRATTALMAHTGSRSVLRSDHAQRLAREALFLAVYGSRPEVRSSLLGLLGATP